MGFVLEGNLFDPVTGPGRVRLSVEAGRIQALEPCSPAEESGLVRPADEWILPGLVDAHTHLLGLGLAPTRPDLSEARSRAELLARLDQWLRAHPGDGPVIAEGFDQSTWDDPALPTRAEIDGVAPRRPVAVRRVCGHLAVFNSAALALLGGEQADLDVSSGLAREALPLSLSRRWPPSEEELDVALVRAQETALSAGVTAVHEMGSGSGLRVFARAALAGRLRLRVSYFFEAVLLDSLLATGLRAGFGDGTLRAAGLKFFLDGSIGGRSAALRGQYADRAESGLLLWDDAALESRLALAAETGWPVALHAIGDRALEQAVSVCERLGARGLRPAGPGMRLEHAEMLDEPLLRRAVEAGCLFSMQPNFTARWQGPGQLYESALGAEGAAALNPFAAAAATGRLLFGSDTMPLDPVLGFRGALLHPRPEERLGFTEAFRLYSEAGAGAVVRPFGRARLLPGEPADLVLMRLPAPPGEMRAEDLPGVRVLATWTDGLLRHADPSVGGSLPGGV